MLTAPQSIRLAVLPGEQSDDLAALAPAERARAATFIDEAARRRFTFRRLAARRVVAGWLGVPTTDVTISAVAGEAPRLLAPTGARLWVSLSSRPSVVAIAGRVGGPVGVDVEQPDPTLAVAAIAARVLAAVEREWYDRLPSSQRGAGLLRCWVAREAVAKGLGGGLRIPLEHFAVDPSSGAVVWSDHRRSPPEPWWVRWWAAEGGVIGAVAAPGQVLQIVPDPGFGTDRLSPTAPPAVSDQVPR